MKSFTFHINGMHCKSCEILIETTLRDVPYVASVNASLDQHTLAISGHFGEMNAEEAASKLTEFIEENGYSLSVERAIKNKNWSDFKIAAPLALVFVALFIFLQKAGIVNLVNAENLSYGTAFIIGIIASLSTCMAVVGGLVLSMSATFAREGDKWRPQLLFHIGRIVSFFILGGVIGALGAAFALNASTTFVLGLVIGLVMLLMGINLLEVFHGAKKWQVGMPKFISRHAMQISKLNHSLTPLLVGVVTFFLPCGFTQSMQIYTLSTGSFVNGALTMLAFALGTLPVLALVSFSSLSIRDNSKKSIFFKTAGLVVIAFALFNIINSFVIIGIIPPIFNF